MRNEETKTMPRHESVRTSPPAAQPAPFRHPYFETARQRQYAAFVREVREFVAVAEAQRARLARARVLESVH
jgi:hypothetical protein